MTRFLLSLLILLIAISGKSQSYTPLSAAAIALELEKLNVLGGALYIAAHPDDENTRLIAYLANERLLRTGYLSLTRGDGGQNLIGTEKGEQIGLLRTQELLEARKIDGGKQFFTRAVDFGYSKSAEETLSKWDSTAILSDVVWVIRNFRPDILITRFPADGYGGHGHHTASAILAEQAFHLAGDPNAFPEQLAHVKPWQPSRLFFNTSTWWVKDLEQKAEASDRYFKVDVGAYNPTLGKSYTEIAGASRSMHKSQGFGAAQERGSRMEYLQHRLGSDCKEDPLEGILLNWQRIRGGQAVASIIEQAIENYQIQKPHEIVPLLLQAYEKMKHFSSNPLVAQKMEDTKRLIYACSGLYLEALVDEQLFAKNTTVQMRATALLRNDLGVRVSSLHYGDNDSTVNAVLTENTIAEWRLKTKTPEAISHASWLQKPYLNTYVLEDQKIIGRDQDPSPFAVTFTLEFLGQYKLTYRMPVYYKMVDRVEGERVSFPVVVPQVTAKLQEQVKIFSNSQPQQIQVLLFAQKETKGTLSLNLPSSWQVSPKSQTYTFAKKGEHRSFSFEVTPPTEPETAELKINIEPREGTTFVAREIVSIQYPHIQQQTLMPLASTKMIRLDLKKEGSRIGYWMGAGDELPEGLKQMGYEVIPVDGNNINSLSSLRLDALMLGVRAYNTQTDLVKSRDQLLQYVKEGGTLIAQYNTSRGLPVDQIGPYSLTISRDRITDENAKTFFVDEQSPLLHYPNKITDGDFANWVQERGLYFASEWDQKYKTLLAWNDPNEPKREGGLLYTKYGEGVFIYTGISFFRQIPAGVPGAYKLLANLIASKKYLISE